jgi:hypothetical protein
MIDDPVDCVNVDKRGIPHRKHRRLTENRRPASDCQPRIGALHRRTDRH